MRNDEKKPTIITSRRAINAALGTLIVSSGYGGTVRVTRALEQISDVPLTFDPADMRDMTKDGLFLPDYRAPMVRCITEHGRKTAWHRYTQTSAARSPFVIIEICAPDANGMPRFAQLPIGGRR